MVTHEFSNLEDVFKDVLKQLSTEDPAYDEAIERAQRYAKSLKNDREFGVVATRIGGSIGKGTAIAGQSDVDLYIYLDRVVWRTRRGEDLLPSTVIGRLRARVEQRLHFELNNGYARIRMQKHSVGIKFKKRNSVGIDIVPALVDGDDIEEALIPRRQTDTFVATSVERQLRLINAMDSPFRYLRRGIRLLKFWARQSDVGLHSYAVEVLGMHAVYRGCKRTPMGVFLSTLDFIAETNMCEPVYIEHFFRFSPPSRRACVIFDPAIPDNNLGAEMDARDGDRLGAAARRALSKLRKAASFAERGKSEIAAECFKEAFGLPG